MERPDFSNSVREAREENITLVSFSPHTGEWWVIYPSGIVEQYDCDPHPVSVQRARKEYGDRLYAAAQKAFERWWAEAKTMPPWSVG